jgi:hypothetical protein
MPVLIHLGACICLFSGIAHELQDGLLVDACSVVNSLHCLRFRDMSWGFRVLSGPETLEHALTLHCLITVRHDRQC